VGFHFSKKLRSQTKGRRPTVMYLTFCVAVLNSFLHREAERKTSGSPSSCVLAFALLVSASDSASRTDVSVFRADYGGLASESGEEVYFLGFAFRRCCCS
jgi:hypothetical protein